MAHADNHAPAEAHAGTTTADANEPRLGYLVRRLQGILKDELDERLSPLGLTARQYTALSMLRSRTGLSNAQLARRCLVSPQSMNEVVSSLDRAGLVHRVPHPANRRTMRVALSERGQVALARCDSAAAALEEQVLRELDDEQRESLISGLESCIRAVVTGPGGT